MTRLSALKFALLQRALFKMRYIKVLRYALIIFCHI